MREKKSCKMLVLKGKKDLSTYFAYTTTTTTNYFKYYSRRGT